MYLNIVNSDRPRKRNKAARRNAKAQGEEPPSRQSHARAQAGPSPLSQRRWMRRSSTSSATRPVKPPNESRGLRCFSFQTTASGSKLERRVRDRTRLTAILESASRPRGDGRVHVGAPGASRPFQRAGDDRLGVRHVDVIGSLISQIGDYLEADPVNIPTAELPLSEEYFRRVEAIEFAVKSDDGKEPRNLHKADLVELAGVSRTSKTPLSTYLAGPWPQARCQCSVGARRRAAE